MSEGGVLLLRFFTRADALEKAVLDAAVTAT